MAGTGGGGGHGGGRGAYNQRNAGNAQALYNELAGIGAAWTDRGYGGYQNLSSDQVDRALGIFGKYNVTDGSAWAYLQNLQAMKRSYDAMHAQEEYQGAMLEMYDRMAKASEAAANRAAQYEQPINDVSVSAAYAKADREAENRQALRRGLLSLTRFGDQAKMQTLGAA